MAPVLLVDNINIPYYQEIKAYYDGYINPFEAEINFEKICNQFVQ